MRLGSFLTTITGLPNDVKVDYDKTIFEQMVNFITELEPEQLTEEQKTRIVDIISSFNLGIQNQYNVMESEMTTKTHSKITEYYNKNKEMFDMAHSMHRGYRW